MDDAAPRFQQRYTRADGTFVWRDTWPGIDGSDDGYEAWHNWPLFHAFGGRDDLRERSRILWDATTRQFTGYGQVWREFDAHYDWMHHGESSLLLYHLGLAGPDPDFDSRVVRFARMYTGHDSAAPNWDPANRLIRSPINGSKGPRFENQWDDWSTHRDVLANYPPPFDDIPGVPGPLADWNDDRTYAKILERLNRNMMTGDVPLNLTSTSLATHAYAVSGDETLRTWVMDYLEAWAQRIDDNGGLCPDNVDEHGRIGGRMEGKWWGGYYGWRWPHGLMTVLQPLVIAAMNAVLLTGDFGYLDIPRSQIDRMIELGRVEDGRLLIPHRRTDDGWTAWRPLAPEFALQLWHLSHDPRDHARLGIFPERQTTWRDILPGRGKGDDIHIAPWHCYLEGDLPDYPDRILETQLAEVARRMRLVESDTSDPETRDVHHWQDRNPVHTEALLQMVGGGPQVIYHGGLLHLRVRPWDPVARRPGLPPDVAALVTRNEPDATRMTLVNTGVVDTRRVLLQGGAYGEHRIESVSIGDGSPMPVVGPTFEIELPPLAVVDIRLGLRRYARRPSTATPW